MLFCRSAAVIPLFAAGWAAGAQVDNLGIQSIREEDWRAAFISPNATGEGSIEGFNMTAPNPGSKSDNWTWTIQVQADVPTSDGQFVAGTWIQLKAPQNLLQDIGNGSIVPQDPSWFVCEQIFIAPMLMSTAGSVDSGCNGFLPPQCLSDMMTGFTRGFRPSGRSTRRCPSIDIPTSCDETFGAGKPPGTTSITTSEQPI